MLDRLRHRGPDSHQISHEDRCAFVHARLSILDVLDGNQPMHLAGDAGKGALSLVFNGEIYNHRSLRSKLERLGHRFQSSHCDTEVLLHGYRAWGTELPKHLHGMFAFAIWDPSAQRLVLVRDRIGQRPLFYHRSQGCEGEVVDAASRCGEIVFASVISAVLAGLPAGTTPPFDRAATDTYLRLGFNDQRAIVFGVEEVLPGHWLMIEAGGAIRTERYWRPPPVSRTSTAIGAVDAACEVIDEAVAERLESDVPLGCVLSGSASDAVVAAVAQRRLESSGKRLSTFSIRLPESDPCEVEIARRVALHIGSDHTELTVKPGDDVRGQLTELTAAMGAPIADSRTLRWFQGYRELAKHVRVVLTGVGGDVLFAGRQWYRALDLLCRYRPVAGALPTPFLMLAGCGSTREHRGRWLRAAKAVDPADAYLGLVDLFTEEQVDHLIADRSGSEARTRPITTRINAQWLSATETESEADHEPVELARRWDLMCALPYGTLRSWDCASMAAGVEARCPLLDAQVCDLAGHLPVSVLMPRGKPGGLLLQVAARLTGGGIRFATLRAPAPCHNWYDGDQADSLVEPLLNGALAGLGFEGAAIETLWAEHRSGAVDHAQRLFALLSLSVWLSWLGDQAKQS